MKYRYITLVILILMFIGWLILLPTKPLIKQADDNQRIITTDWTIAETLLALEAPLVGMGDKKEYDIWVNYPYADSNIADLGSRTQPNLEAITNLAPNLLINATWLQNLLPPSMTPIPFVAADFYSAQGLSWDNLLTTTRQLASVVNKQENAENLIAQTVEQLNYNQQLLQNYQETPFAIVQFIDSRHLRIYGENSLYGLVLSRLHLVNAWQNTTNAWGFTQITLLTLAQLPQNTLLIIVPPYPANVYTQLQNSTLWQALPVSSPKQHRVISAVWAFGALPAIQRFNQQFTDAVLQPQSSQW